MMILVVLFQHSGGHRNFKGLLHTGCGTAWGGVRRTLLAPAPRTRGTGTAGSRSGCACFLHGCALPHSRQWNLAGLDHRYPPLQS